MIGKLNQFKNHPILGVDDDRMFGIPFEQNGTMVIHPPGRLEPSQIARQVPRARILKTD